MLNSEIINLLACPVCKSDIEWIPGENILVCLGYNCGKKYPIGPNDIPILIPDIEEYEKRYGWKYQKKGD